MAEELVGLRRALSAAVAGLRGGERRYPTELKSRVAAYARRRLAEGAKLAPVAVELGLPRLTLARWVATPANAFRPVAVKSPRFMGTQLLALVSPRGFRVEGLDLGEVTTLLRALA